MPNNTMLKTFQEKLRYCFSDEKLLFTALTHSSYANEHRLNKIQHNERLEFLGDAVLELVSSNFLYKNYPNMNEGEMSKKRASLVCEPALARCAVEMELGKFLLLGKGEAMSGGRERDSILADAVEATIGAIYLDGGLDAASDFIMKNILNDVSDKKVFEDSKTVLQEMVQREHLGTISYELVDTIGPDHDRRFVMEVSVAGRVMGKGVGRTKQAAGQSAACEAIRSMKG